MFYHVKAERVKSDMKYLQKSLKDTIVPEVSHIIRYPFAYYYSHSYNSL